MDPRYQSSDSAFDNRSFQPEDLDGALGGSALEQRASRWVQTPGGRFPAESVYFVGNDDERAFTLDPNAKSAFTINERSVQPTPDDSPRHSVDLEKQNDKNHQSSLDLHRKDASQPKLPFGQRLRHFTWAWYTLTMSTGGVATLISIQPHQFPGLITIGAIFYILNLFFFAIVCGFMVLRFTKFPGAFKDSLCHEREGLFFPTFWLSVATIITGTQKYVIVMYESNDSMRGWMLTSMSIAFWAYVVCTFAVAVIQYSFLFVGHTYLLTKFMPSWLLPIFPVMLAGTIASVIAADQPLQSRFPILVAGLGCQGLGFTVSIIMYAHYIGRLMQVGLPNREHRGAMFIGVGPPSFTCLAFIGMANALPQDFDLQRDGLMDGHLLRTMALVSAIFLWVLAMWFFMIAIIGVLHSRPKDFHLGWWAMVFPNTGFVIATISIGNALQDEVIRYVGNALTICIVCMWAFVLYHNIRAVIVSEIMYPGRDEDVED